MTVKKPPGRRGAGLVCRLEQSKCVANSPTKRRSQGIIESAMHAAPVSVLSGPLDRKRWKERGVPVKLTRSVVAKIRSTRIPEVLLPANHTFWQQVAADLALILATLRPRAGRNPSGRVSAQGRAFLNDAIDECGSWRVAAHFLAGMIAGMLPRPQGAPDERDELDRVLGTKPSQQEIVEEARRVLAARAGIQGKAAVREALKRLGIVDDPRFFRAVKRLSDKPRKR